MLATITENVCVFYNSVDNVFPSVTLVFDGKGATLTLKPHEYMIQVEGTMTITCHGFKLCVCVCARV